MKILFIGGDKRQLQIINSLSNHEIDVIGYEKIELWDSVNKKELTNININDYQVIILPINGVKSDLSIVAEYSDKTIILPEDFFINTKKDVLIFSGIRTVKLDIMLKLAEREVIALMEDENVKKENSIPTVEGIIGDLIFYTEHTINRSRILVLGYGNIGKPLVETLTFLGAEVTIGVILEEDYRLLKDKNKKIILTNNQKEMSETLKEIDIVVNTVPSLIIDKTYLEVINKNCYILDIASYPHGIDFAYANEKGIKNKLLLGIPSIVAPKTTGLILAKKIKSMLGGKND